MDDKDKMSLIAKLIEDHKRIYPHHSHLCELCKEAEAAIAASSKQSRPTVKQLAAQLTDNKPWTRAEQDSFAVFLARFPNESSQGIISLGDAWKAGRVFESAAAPAAPLPAHLSQPTPRDIRIAQAVRQACVESYSPDISSHDWSEAMADIDLAGVIRRAAPLPELTGPSEPNQPLILDKHGTQRFRENVLVRYLLDNGPISLNDLAEVECSVADREQFAQLIGYSLSGYGELSYVTDERFYAAQSAASPSPAPAQQQEPSVQVKFDDAWDSIDWDVWRMRPIRELVEHLHDLTVPKSAETAAPGATEDKQ